MGRQRLPRGLRKNILHSIQREELHRARRYLLASLGTGLASIAGLVLTVRYTLQGFSQSGFYNYLSLLLSDPDIALSHWKEFAFSLIETLPFLEITLSIGAVLLFMVSVRVFVKHAREGLLTPRAPGLSAL